MSFLLFNTKADCELYNNSLISSARQLYELNGYKLDPVTRGVLPKDSITRQTIRSSIPINKWSDPIEAPDGKYWIPNPENAFQSYIGLFNTLFTSQTGIAIESIEELPIEYVEYRRNNKPNEPR